jgi:hypothetical protein
MFTGVCLVYVKIVVYAKYFMLLNLQQPKNREDEDKEEDNPNESVNNNTGEEESNDANEDDAKEEAEEVCILLVKNYSPLLMTATLNYTEFYIFSRKTKLWKYTSLSRISYELTTPKIRRYVY